MNEREKQEWWTRTVAALNQRDPRLHAAMLTALVLRHGKLEQCSAGHTHVRERFTVEDLIHTVNEYHFGTRIVEYGIIEIEAVPKGDVHGQPPNPGEAGGLGPFRSA